MSSRNMLLLSIILIVILLVISKTEVSKSSLKSCQFDEDCIWMSDESCEGCWNKNTTYDVVGHGMCIKTYCTCENNVCRHPSKEWILQNKNLAIEKCMVSRKDICLPEIAFIFNDSSLCMLFENEQEQKDCQDDME
ncbi:MAG: hypothetical protein KAJ24_04915 [Candidatus Aenigmarchaeota archaeon]|nr:hypothetical protein [Candidatus Aenigmarchaeota archaeon]